MLSVVLATHNEAANLERCLQSVADLADEIVVVDGESTDNTVALAKKLGARVIKTTNKANFHINKQHAIDAAKGDLILQLDADEVVDEELRGFISSLDKRVLKSQPLSKNWSGPVAWWIKRRNNFMGHWFKKGGQYPDPVIRLFLADKAHLPQKDVHEQMEVDGEIGWADGHLLHYSNPRFSDYLRKFQTYTSFKAEQLQTAGVTAGLGSVVTYLVIKPVQTFMSLFVRHKGFVDGIPGLVFAMMSGAHHAVAYLKWWEKYARPA